MKKASILLSLSAALLYLTLSSYSGGPGSSALLELTGVTGTVGCGSGCHGSSATTSTVVTVELLSGSTPVTSYTPGSSYTIRVTGTQTSSSFTLPRFGFQATCVKLGSSVNAGTMTAPAGGHIATVSGVKVAEQSSAILATTGTGAAGTTYVVNIPWTAPVAGTGTVTLRAVINAVNFNFSDEIGDKWNSATPVNITEGSTSGVSPITGTLSVCVGNTTTLSDATPGGTWSSSNPSIATVTSLSGVVSGIAAGTAVITYNAGSSGIATATVTVNPLPAPIVGVASVCVGSTTMLSDATSGGTWSASPTVIATVGATTGVVTGISAGLASITYTLSTGCRTSSTVTVNALPAPITGPASVCAGLTITLFDGTGGGTWSSSAPPVATVGSATGVVTGVSAGSAIITYTLPTGCSTAKPVTVDAAPVPAAITGPAIVCAGSTITLADATPGGTWTSLHTSTATVGSSTGVVTGIAVGPDTIVYTVTNSCGTGSVSYPISVHAAGTCATGVVPADITDGLHIFPNPSNGTCNITIPGTGNMPAKVTITDLTGRPVKVLTLPVSQPGVIKLDLPAGVYILSATTAAGTYEGRIMIE